MTPTVRRRLLFGLLAACAAAVAWDRLRAAPPPVVAEAVARPATSTSEPPAVTRATHAASHGLLALQDRAGYDAVGGDAFPSVAPPPTALPASSSAPVEAPRPTAPALPFTVIGKKQDAGRWEVYLARGDQTLVATVGAALGAEYRVTAITPSRMTLIYLPLQETQLRPIGAAFDD